jgi:hypothetical protein
MQTAPVAHPYLLVSFVAGSRLLALSATGLEDVSPEPDADVPSLATNEHTIYAGLCHSLPSTEPRWVQVTQTHVRVVPVLSHSATDRSSTARLVWHPPSGGCISVAIWLDPHLLVSVGSMCYAVYITNESVSCIASVSLDADASCAAAIPSDMVRTVFRLAMSITINIDVL